MKTDGKIYTAGIDSGSTSTDAVIMDKDAKIIGKAIGTHRLRSHKRS